MLMLVIVLLQAFHCATSVAEAACQGTAVRWLIRWGSAVFKNAYFGSCEPVHIFSASV